MIARPHLATLALTGALLASNACARSIPPADQQFVAEWMRNCIQEAADEAAMSRLYGGIHFRMANENDKVLGRCIGRTVLERLHTRPPQTR